MCNRCRQPFFDATRDSATRTLYVKVVNRGAAAQAVHITVSGVAVAEQADKPSR